MDEGCHKSHFLITFMTALFIFISTINSFTEGILGASLSIT